MHFSWELIEKGEKSAIFGQFHSVGSLWKANFVKKWLLFCLVNTQRNAFTDSQLFTHSTIFIRNNGNFHYIILISKSRCYVSLFIGRFICSKCGRGFDHKWLVSNHACKDAGIYTCTVCGQVMYKQKISSSCNHCECNVMSSYFCRIECDTYIS